VVGLSTSASLLERGVDVTCYERSAVVMNERSAGSSRIFRLAHGTVEMVLLADAARSGFHRWEQAAGVPLITPSGCVVSGPKARVWAAAMEAAGAAGELVDGTSGRLSLPARTPPSEALIDPAGGVIDVDAVRAHLTAVTGGSVVHEPVYALEAVASGAVVWTPSGRAEYDVAVVAAGAGTSPLASQVGLYTPSALEHAVRFSFPAGRSADWQCWIDTPAVGLGTYQHQSGLRTWSVGAHLDPAAMAWEVGRDAATAVSEESVLRYAREHLVVEPRIVARLYCVTTPNSNDGFTVRRNGSILAVYGDNLFKLAPILGEMLAAACRDGSTPSVAARDPS
jgi:sarcosine oxidase